MMSAMKIPGKEVIRRGDLAKASELVARRKSLGFSQVQLAEAIGKSPRSVQNYETAEWPIPKHVDKLIDYLEQEAVNVV